MPKSTQARAPYTPITVTQPSACTPLSADASGNALDYETCVVTISIAHDYSRGVHFSVSFSGKDCYYTCDTTNTGASAATPEGTTLTYAYYPVHVMLIVPYYEPHGTFTMTFTFHGPSNSSSVQMIATNSCC